jgi:hypothetical protein
MQRITLASVTIVVLFNVANLFAQGGQKNTGVSGNNGPTAPAPFFVSGKVSMDDGSPLPSGVQIVSVCRGQRHTETHTDSKGNFSFEMGRQAAVGEDISNGAGASRPGQASSDPDAMPTMTGQVLSNRDFRDCQVTAALPGYSSQLVDISKHGDWGSVDVPTIRLHRSEQAAASISVTTAQAPDGARKAFEKGREEERKKNLDGARKQFEKAVGEYPKFAEAWVELGRVQEAQKDMAGAQASFTRASQADSQLVTPYHELAGMAFDQQKWNEVLENSSQVLKLNPNAFPDDWYFSAVGNYSLQKYDEAEKSARGGLKVDTLHRFPRLEYLLGVILVQEKNYPEAVEHMQNYLKLDPHAEDAGTITKQIAELQKYATAQPAAKN